MKFRLAVVLFVLATGVAQAQEAKPDNPAAAAAIDGDRKITLTVNELQAIIRSQVQLAMAQYLAQTDLAAVTKQLPQAAQSAAPAPAEMPKRKR
jgi:hypothetical protein